MTQRTRLPLALRIRSHRPDYTGRRLESGVMRNRAPSSRGAARARALAPVPGGAGRAVHPHGGRARRLRRHRPAGRRRRRRATPASSSAPTAVLVVDAFATPGGGRAAAGRDSRAARRCPIRWLVLTHFHLGPLGGSAVFAKAGRRGPRPRERARLGARASGSRTSTRGRGARYAALRPAGRDATATALSIWLGDRRVDVVHEARAHRQRLARLRPRRQRALRGRPASQSAASGPNLSTRHRRVDPRRSTSSSRAFPTATFVPGHGEVGKAARRARLPRLPLDGLRLVGRAGAARREVGRRALRGAP